LGVTIRREARDGGLADGAVGEPAVEMSSLLTAAAAGDGNEASDENDTGALSSGGPIDIFRWRLSVAADMCA
jgi:hypothetical protein